MLKLFERQFFYSITPILQYSSTPVFLKIQEITFD